MEHAIIDNYRDLPIGVYLDILEIQDNEPDELRRQCRIIAALAALKEADVLGLPLDEYKRLRARAAFLREPCPEDQLRIANRYVLGHWALQPVQDQEKLTVAQYVDFQTFCREPEQHFPELLSVLLVPEGHAYNDGYDIRALQSAIREDMNVADAVALVAHFFASSSESILSTLNFSRSLAGQMKEGPTKRTLLQRLTEAEAVLSGSGAGSQPSTPSPSSAAAPGRTSGK